MDRLGGFFYWGTKIAVATDKFKSLANQARQQFFARYANVAYGMRLSGKDLVLRLRARMLDYKIIKERIFMDFSHISKPDYALIEKRCPRYQKCAAPLCPLDKNIERRIWFPDEPICRAMRFRELDWVRNQRKIKKRARDKSRYFTIEMLKQNCRIRTGIKGLSPNIPSDKEEKQVQKWLSKHPPQRSISLEERKKFREEMENSTSN